MKNIFTAILFLSVAFGFGQKKPVVKKEPDNKAVALPEVKRPMNTHGNVASDPNANHIKGDSAGDKKEGINVEYSQIFTSVELPAKPLGGMDAFRNKIVTSFPLPEVDEPVTGTVIAKFVVWDDGSIRDIMIVKESPAGLGLGKEFVKLLKNSEKWTPAQVSGKNVKQYYTFPLTIQIPAFEETSQPTEEIKKEETPIVKESNITSPEKQAEPIGGIKKFYTQLSSNMQVPDVEVAGTYKTKVKFIVNQDGSLSDYQVLEETPFNVGLGQNVIKYLQSIEKWIPSEQNGRKVKTYFVLPVTTIIENEPETEPKKE